jgi:type IV pilus assembly protein PilV
MKPCSIQTPRLERESGFGLIEVLVAMLVLAIGLLGLAALQTQGVRFNHDAMVRTQATALAYDIIEKMRANSLNTAAGGATAYVSPPDAAAANFPAPPGPYACVSNGPATPANDLGCWLNAVELALPLGRATIVRQAADPRFFDITLMWLDREPRDIGGVTKLAENAAECNPIPSRLWVAAAGRCFVTQTWTVFP